MKNINWNLFEVGREMDQIHGQSDDIISQMDDPYNKVCLLHSHWEKILIKALLCILSLLLKSVGKNWWPKFVWEGQFCVMHYIISISSSIC